MPETSRQTTEGKAIHPLMLRIAHWGNAVAMLVLIASGWQIYNAAPIAPFTFPAPMTLGGWLGGALLWHFAAMWLAMVSFIFYVIYGFASGRFSEKFSGFSFPLFFSDIRAALSGTLIHDKTGQYNAVQKLLYVGIIVIIALAILSGLAIWKPVQFQWLTAFFGGFQFARLVHFITMILICGFLLIHMVMAFLVPASLRAIISG